MYLVRKHIKENNTELIIPLFVTDEDYAERYVKYQNKGIKLFQDAAKEQHNKGIITDEEIIDIMNNNQAANDFIVTKDDLYKDIVIDFIEIPFYEGKILENTFVPGVIARSLAERATHK